MEHVQQLAGFAVCTVTLIWIYIENNKGAGTHV